MRKNSAFFLFLPPASLPSPRKKKEEKERPFGKRSSSLTRFFCLWSSKGRLFWKAVGKSERRNVENAGLLLGFFFVRARTRSTMNAHNLIKK